MKPIEKMTMETIPARFDGRDSWVMWGKINDEIIPAINEILTKGINMTTLTPPNEWVSVDEKFPEDNTQVLMWSARWKIAEAGSYYNQHFWVYSEIGDEYIADNITHWMPLPLPPEKEE